MLQFGGFLRIVANKDLYAMYKKEHESFCTNLMSKDHPHEETNKAWKILSLTVNGEI